MQDKKKMTAQMSSAATDNGQSLCNANSITEKIQKINTEILSSDELRMQRELSSKFAEYLDSVGMKNDGSDDIICPSCGMFASLYSNGTKWICDDCGSSGDIIDYCVLSDLFPDKRSAISALSKQYGIKRSELELIAADKLLGMEFKEIPDIIKGFLCPGLTMIYGSPKVGKSWLVLQIAIAVSKGENFWNRPTQKGKVVYLALEDTYRRLKTRLSAQTDVIDNNLQFVIDSEILGGGLETQLYNLMQSHSDTKVIIIDTFQRIRNPMSNSYSYADDYREVEILKQLAAKHEIAIILVHHKRKMKASDPLDEVSGTNGLTGSADTLMILNRKKRTGRTGKLIISGRDIPGEEIDMTFSDKTMSWEMLNTIIEPADDEAIIEAVVRFMSEHKKWSGTATELLEQINIPDIPIKANRLSAILFEARSELLSEHHITLEKDRTSSRKIISLSHTENDDDDADDYCDADDDNDDGMCKISPA